MCLTSNESRLDFAFNGTPEHQTKQMPHWVDLKDELLVTMCRSVHNDYIISVEGRGRENLVL